jgi:1,4-dihydroxy-6-naphthoate synthase
VRQSIQHALDHREQALQYAMQFARDLDHQLADRFVGMYVNGRTLDYGEDGRHAIRELLRRGHKAGIIPHKVKVDFVE